VKSNYQTHDLRRLRTTINLVDAVANQPHQGHRARRRWPLRFTGDQRQPDDRYRPAQLPGITGNGKPVRFHTRQVFEFRDGRISRKNLWLDGAGLAAQLTN
jgi:hypothetical protein